MKGDAAHKRLVTRMRSDKRHKPDFGGDSSKLANYEWVYIGFVWMSETPTAQHLSCPGVYHCALHLIRQERLSTSPRAFFDMRNLRRLQIDVQVSLLPRCNILQDVWDHMT